MSIVSVHGPHTWGQPFFAESPEIYVNLIGDLYIEVKARRLHGLVYPDPYTWQFGDGSTQVNGYEVTHTYGEPDVYTITLKVRTTSGLITDSITINLSDGFTTLMAVEEEETPEAA